MIKYEKYFNMGESCITIAQPFSDKARMAMSSLVHALHELDSYAVARIVPKKNKEPSIILLAPYIVPGELEALIDVPLPFSEDVRTHRYPPLDRVVTSSGAVLRTHKNLPKEELNDAMSDYIDSMDLSKFRTDEDGYVCSQYCMVLSNKKACPWNICQSKKYTIQIFIA